MSVSFKFIALLLATLWLSACSDNAPIKVGFIGGLSGRFADLGQSGRNGAMIAVDWRNARGGIQGQPVTLLIQDDQHDPNVARQALRALIAEKAMAIVGPMTSSMAGEIVPVADETGTVLIGGTIVTDRLTGKNDHLIRVISDTREYSAQTARQLEKMAPGEKTAILYDLANRDYAEDWAKNYALEANRLGNAAITLHSFDSRQTGAVQTAVDQAFGQNAQAPKRILMVCSAKDAVQISRLARTKAPDIRLASAAWAATEQLLAEGKDVVEGMFLQEYYNVDDSGETFRAFSGEFTQRFGRKPDYAAVIAFDAMNVLLDGITAHPKREGLRDAILARRQYSGLNGMITLDAFGDASRPYFAATVKNGRFVSVPSVP